MKKLHILIPSLVATIGMPFISLTSCGEKEEDKIDSVEIAGEKQLFKGEEATYTAYVAAASGNPDKSVTWSIKTDQDQTGSTIDKTTGKFTAGNEVGTVIIKATCVFDNTKTAEFTVNVVIDIKSVSIINQTQALPTSGTWDYVATVETFDEEDKEVTWEIVDDESSTGSTITSAGHFVAGATEGKVVIKATSVKNASKFATLDVYVQDTSPVSSIELDSDNAIVFGQSTIVQPKAISTIDGIYVETEVTGCDVGETGATWDEATSTLTAGATAGSVTITCKAVRYAGEFTVTISIVQNIFKYSIDENENAIITGIENDDYKFVSVLPTIVDNGTDHNVTTIGEAAFQFSVLNRINLKNATNLTKIEIRAFWYAKIDSIYIPNSVQSIGTRAFEYTPKLKSVYIEKGSQLEFTGEEDSVFGGAVGSDNYLETINLENASKITCLPTNFIQCQPIKSITIPASVTKINAWAFWKCSNLSTINFLGTKQQWRAIEKDEGGWHSDVPTNIVHCSDGNCRLDERL